MALPKTIYSAGRRSRARTTSALSRPFANCTRRDTDDPRRLGRVLVALAYADVPWTDMRDILYEVIRRSTGNRWGNGNVLCTWFWRPPSRTGGQRRFPTDPTQCEVQRGRHLFFNQYHVHPTEVRRPIEVTRASMTIPFFSKTEYSLELDGAFGNPHATTLR